MTSDRKDYRRVREELAALFRTRYEPLRRFAYRLVNDEAVAHDLVLDAFGQLVPHFESAAPAERDRRLYSTIRHRAKNEYRRRERHARVSSYDESDLGEDGLPPRQGDPIARVVERLALDTCRAKLSEPERAVLALKVELDLTYSEIAGVLDLPSDDAAFRLMKKALMKMRGCLAATDAESDYDA